MSSIQPHQVSCALLIHTILERSLSKTDWKNSHVQPQTSNSLLLAVLRLIKDNEAAWSEFYRRVHAIDSDAALAIRTCLASLRNVDQFLDLMKLFVGMLDSSMVHRSSIIGLFIRKLMLNFKKMTFAEHVNLFSRVKEYLNAASEFMQGCNVESNVHGLGEGTIKFGGSTVVNCSKNGQPSAEQKKLNSIMSRDRAERFIRNQARLLEDWESAALPPNLLQNYISDVCARFPDLTDVHFLTFLNCLRVAELSKSAVSLQQFFDYKVFKEEALDADSSDSERHQMKFKRFRYCALLLGILHCCHGNNSEALTSLQEAIMISQETNDQTCLDHAMFWMSLVTRSYGADAMSVMNLLASKALRNEDADGIEDAFHAAQPLDTLAVLHICMNEAYQGTEKPHRIFHKIRNVLFTGNNLVGAAHCLRSALWDFYGYSGMSSYCCQHQLLYCHSDPDKILRQDLVSEESMVLSVCQLAHHHAGQGMFDEAFLCLKFFEQRLTVQNKLRKQILLCRSQIEFDRHVLRRDVQAAAKTLGGISLIDKDDSTYRGILLNLLRGNVVAAKKTIAAHLSASRENFSSTSCVPRSVQQARLRLLSIELQLLSSSPLLALSSVVELLADASDIKSLRYEIEGRIALARCQLLMGLPEEAGRLLNDITVSALSHGTAHQHGLIDYLKALSVLSASRDASNGEKKPVFLTALSLLDSSLASFKKCEARARLKDVYLHQAQIYHLMEYSRERNQCATLYRQLHEQLRHFPDLMCL